MEDVEELLFSELELPRLRPSARRRRRGDARRSTTTSRARARSSTRRRRCARTSCATRSAGGCALGGIDKPDLRYLSYRELPKPRHKAVIFLAMDVSGSMDAGAQAHRAAVLLLVRAVPAPPLRPDRARLHRPHHRGARGHRARVLQPHGVRRHARVLGVRGGARRSSTTATRPRTGTSTCCTSPTATTSPPTTGARSSSSASSPASARSSATWRSTRAPAAAATSSPRYYEQEVADLDGFVFAAARRGPRAVAGAEALLRRATASRRSVR